MEPKYCFQAPHLILIESLQQLYVKELLYRRSRRPLPSDVEEALLLYINECVMHVKEEWGRVSTIFIGGHPYSDSLILSSTDRKSVV